MDTKWERDVVHLQATSADAYEGLMSEKDLRKLLRRSGATGSPGALIRQRPCQRLLLHLPSTPPSRATLPQQRGGQRDDPLPVGRQQG